MKIYKCRICGNLVHLLENGGGNLVCCGESMELLTAKTSNEGLEKHVPVVSVLGNKVNVKVGSVDHPMVENHYITKIFVAYNNKIIVKKLNYMDKPEADFIIDEEFKTLDVYEYCNLHDLWKTTYTK